MAVAPAVVEELGGGRVSRRLPMAGPTPLCGLGRIWDFGKAHQVNCCGPVMGLVLIGESILRICFLS